MPVERTEVACRCQRRRNAVRRHGGVIDPVGAIQKSDARVLHAERLEFAGGRQGRRWLYVEVNTVGRSRDAQVRDGREPRPSFDHDDARVADVQSFGACRPPEDFELPGDRVVDGSGGVSVRRTERSLGHPHQEHDIRFVTDDTGVEGAHDLEVRPGRADHRRGENRVFWRAHG